MRRLLWVFAFLATVSTVAAVWLWFDLRGEQARNLALHDLLAKFDAIHAGAVDAKASNSPTKMAASPAPNQSVPAPAERPLSAYVPAENVNDEIAHQRRLLSDPNYRDAWREQQRVLYSRRRGNLIRVVGLTPEQADAVMDVQINRELSLIENATEPTDAQAKADEAADQQRLRELIGEDKRQQLQSYMESRSTRMRVDDFRSELSGAEALRDDQVEPLIAALHVEDARMRDTLDDYHTTLFAGGDTSDARRRYADRQLETLKATYERMHAAAAPILTSPQLDKFDGMLKRDFDRRNANQRVWNMQADVEQENKSAIKAN